MGNGFSIDIYGIKEILNQIFKSKVKFPITEKKDLIRALGGETNLVKINSRNETASAVILAETAYSFSQVFHNSNDIVDGIVGGSFTNALTKSKIYNELQELNYPVKHLRDLEKLGVTLRLHGIPWEQVKERIDLPVSTSAEIVLAISSADPAVVGTDISIIDGLNLPDITKRPTPPSRTTESAIEDISVEEVQGPPTQSSVEILQVDEVTPQPPESPPLPPEAPSVSHTAPAAPSPAAQPPVDRKTAGDFQGVELKLGFSYLVKEDKPNVVFDAFVSSQKNQYAGLLITRTHPRQVRGKFDLGNLKIHWLTDRKSSEELTLAPALESISYLIEGFVKKNERSMVLLDGLEYLISVNKFNPVLAFIRRLVDFFSEHDAVFLAPISPMTIGEQELKTLEREMEPVEEGEALKLPDSSSKPSGDMDVVQEPAGTPAATTAQPGEQTSADSNVSAQISDTKGSGKKCTPCEGTGRCFWCSGTGKCESCNGTGKTESGANCENCSGSGVCDSCKGATKCVWCKGTGQLIEE